MSKSRKPPTESQQPAHCSSARPVAPKRKPSRAKNAAPVRPVGEVLEDLRLVLQAGGDTKPLLAEMRVSLEAQGRAMELEFKRQNAEMDLICKVSDITEQLVARVRRMEDRMSDMFPGMSWPALDLASPEGQAPDTAPAAVGRLVLLRGGRDE